MARSIWKGPFTPKIEERNGEIAIKKRAGTITPDLLNLQVKIHNGLSYSKSLTISTNHIGKKFGSLTKTKKKGAYKGGAKAKSKSK